MTKNKDKLIISLEIPTELFNLLKQKATEETISISAYIRRLIIKDLKKDDK